MLRRVSFIDYTSVENMSMRLQLTGCLRDVPVWSSACLHLYRRCSNLSKSRAQEQVHQTQTNPLPNSNSETAAVHVPASLDLGLNFSTMNFEEVARCTQAAIARERGGGHFFSKREQAPHVPVEKYHKIGVAIPESIPAAVPICAAPVEKGSLEVARKGSSSASRQMHGEPSSSMAPQEPTTLPHTPPLPFANRRAQGRYTLQDMLKDCMTEGQWSRAFQLFTTAVEQACQQVLVSGVAAKAVAAGNGLYTSSLADSREMSTPVREVECFSVLRKMLAALPPTRRGDRTAHVNSMRGVMRWTGRHYYLLWKCLLEAGRLEDLQRVWFVMQQTGFVEYQMDERTLNAMMALLRRTSSTTEFMITTVVSPGLSLEETTAHHKRIRRELVKGLEQAAVAHKFRLDGVNRRTAEGIRIVEAVERAEQGNAPASTGAPSPDSAHALSPCGSDEAVVAVGDFNGLLRRAKSVNATDRILDMMAKLNIKKDAVTYASLIAALHHPQYVLVGHTAEELATHQASGDPSRPDANREEGKDSMKVSLAPIDGNSGAADLSVTKSLYEAYKQKRIEVAMVWFTACPQKDRTADVFNELLYLLRAKAHWFQFDTLLVQFRGNAVVAQAKWSEELVDVESPASPLGNDVSDSPSSPVPILPPNWSTPPNGKTYELLIHRARYLHQWEVMWALYNEMLFAGVPGTARVYEVLIMEARSHPPKWVLSARRSGSVDPTSTFMLGLYDELRRNGGDVNSFKGTLNVINAWTRSRSKLNRWDS